MFKKLLHFIILSRRKEVPFIIFFSFLVTFILSRLIVYGIQQDIFPKFLEIFFSYIYIKEFHIHHLNFGILILALTGFISIIRPLQKQLYKMAAIYGIGLGLTFDEFALWFTLNDNYWNRLSIDAIIVISGIFLNIIYFKNFWRKLGGHFKKTLRRVIKLTIKSS